MRIVPPVDIIVQRLLVVFCVLVENINIKTTLHLPCVNFVHWVVNLLVKLQLVLNVQLIHIKIKTHKNPSVVKPVQILDRTKINRDNLVAKTTFVDVQQVELQLLEVIVLLTTLIFVADVPPDKSW